MLIKEHAQLDEEISIQDERNDFYRIINKIYASVTSVLSFSPHWAGQYDLISFRDISREWDDLKSLQFGNAVDANSLNDYSGFAVQAGGGFTQFACTR